MKSSKTTGVSKSAADNFLIVGAGIIGLSLGLRLQLAGRQVTIIDRHAPASGTSYGNAGYLAEGNIFPPASPDMLKKLPSLLFDRKGPLVVKPHYLPHLIGWGIKVLASSRASRQAEIMSALSEMNRKAIGSYAPLLKAASAEHLFNDRGSLVLCRTAAMLQQKRAAISTLRAHGISVEELSRDEIGALEPSVSPDIAGGLFYPNNVHCLNPGALGQKFADAIRRNGGDILRDRVERIEPTTDGWQVQTEKGFFLPRELAVCAGWWSAELLKPLGYKVPLASERGYHLMLPHPQVTLMRPIVMAEHYFAATPMEEGLRLAGTAEFANPEAPMDNRRAEILHDLARPYLPGIENKGAARWMGVRPSFPDALPAIGIAHRHNGLFYSFGHQHLGLTQGAISAELLASTINTGTTPTEMTPMTLSRFD